MPFDLVSELTETDLHLRDRCLSGFVPDRVFDIHAHLLHTSHFAPGTRPACLEADHGYGLPDFERAMERLLPDRKIDGLFFGYPLPGNDRAAENEWVREQIEAQVATSNSRALALAGPRDDPNEIRKLLETTAFVGVKPYRHYAEVANTNAAPIESFAPRWMWELCEEYDGVLMLHIMRSGGIADPLNVEALQRLSRQHPRCRVVLPHVARSFNYRHAWDGLHSVANLPNIYLDASAITDAGAFRAALRTLGPQRLLWGSDYFVSELRGKCVSHGDGFTWIYSEHESAANLTATGQFTTIGIESLICLREACEETEMTDADVQDIFYHNALRLLRLTDSANPA